MADPAASAIAQAAELLRACGQRMTGPRRAVLSALAHSREHLTADQVVASVAAGTESAHRASVYRTLDVLAELHIVQRVFTRGVASYHLAAENPHVHAQCLGCARVQDLPGEVLAPLRSVLAQGHRFTLDSLHTVLSGWCADCAAGGA